jgi:AhpD family alkylhydroperoxidase
MIPLVTRADAPLLARPYLEDGDNPLAAALAHVPELLEVAMPFFGVVYGPTALPERLKEIVVLRTSARNGCRYCTRVHATLAAATGLDAAEIVSLQPGAAAPASLAESERAAFAFSEAMCDRPAGAVALLKPFFRDDQIVELTLLAATTISLNRFCTAVGLT